MRSDRDPCLSRRDLFSPQVLLAVGRWSMDLMRDLTTILLRLVGLADKASAPTSKQQRPVFPRAIGNGPPPHRPPGARSEARFLEVCTRCHACIQACPFGVIQPSRQAGASADTPVIIPLQRGCEMCEDFPCIAACPTGALLPGLPVKMGTATVVGHCLNHHGSTCRICHEQCPVDGAMQVVDGLVEVEPDVCTGCGICEQVCPAPINAILLVPRRDRPEPMMKPPGLPSADAAGGGHDPDDGFAGGAA